MTKRSAFTLIELLIVVAIIAILAAIAVPNFLEAQVRSKVSRQKSNMRTVQTALESYAVDNLKYPLWTKNSDPRTPNPPGVSYVAEEIWKVYPGYPSEGYAGGLTTPIGYIASINALEDIFRLPHNFDSDLANQIMYLPSQEYDDRPNTYRAQVNRYGLWVMRSAGPDTYYQNFMHLEGDYGAGGWNRASYDPTNGTISDGDIYRSQRSSDESHAGYG